MPLLLLERIPLPSLRTYTAISVGLLSLSVYYAVQVSSDPDWKVNSTSKIVTDVELQKNDSDQSLVTWGKAQNASLLFQLQEVVHFMIQEPLCIWTLVNMAYCCLILLGTFIQKLVFGELRVSEQQHVKDKFWNFIFYKFIFVFGIINVQFLDEVVLWCAWFSVLGFLNLLAQLGKDRFEYLSFSPTTPGWNHFRLLSLLACIFMLSGFMFLVCVAVGFFVGFNTFAFMAAECIQLNIRTLHVILRYAFHLYDMRQGDNSSSPVWEKRGPLAYYTELIFELAVLLLDFVHHLHMLLWSNIFLSMASLVICMQLRYLFHEIQRRIKKHRNYLWVLNHMEQNYPMATPEELSNHTDNCAICWEEMESARKLPCSHLFHNACLQSWLEQDTSCPTCRMVLSIQSRNILDAVSRLEHSLENNVDNQQTNRRPPNHFFHFDGSRYVSWLPSFSVEVTHTQLRNHQVQPVQTSQFDAMARQVQQLFPHIPLSVVIEDLRLSRSVELTIENILDGRVVVPPHLFQREQIPAPVVERRSDHVPDRTTDNSLWEEKTLSGTSDSEETVNLSGKFSKSSTERERILHKRKEQLILSARQKYLEKYRKNKERSVVES